MFQDKLSLFLVVFLSLAAGSFVIWGLGYINSGYLLIFLLATAFGLFMAFNIGGNDVANSFGTSVGAGTLSIRQALVVAAIFEVSGAMIAGGAVTDTIRKGIVDLSQIVAAPSFDLMDFVYIMMAALLAAAIWLLIATRRGWPVSTTHSIVGGIVGASLTLGFIGIGSKEALSLVQWDKIGTIALSWLLSPLLGGLVSYVLFYNIKRFVLDYNDQADKQLRDIKKEKLKFKKEHTNRFEKLTELQKLYYTQAMARDGAIAMESGEAVGLGEFESEYYRELHRIDMKRENIQAHRALEIYLPLLAALGSMIITAMLIYKGLGHIDTQLTDYQNVFIILMVAASVWMAIYILSRTMKGRSLKRSTFLLFSWMQVFTASGFAFSHGSNDIANAIGPFAAVLDVLHSGQIGSQAPIPAVAMFAFGFAMVAGLWFIGKEVIQTVGTNLTKMHPASGFSAELAAAAVVILASSFGIPVSSTHILVGAVLGIGLVNHAANWNLMKPIALAWIITLPSAATLASLVFIVLRTTF